MSPRRSVGERQRSGEGLVEHHAECPNIGAVIHVGKLECLLRSHVVGRSQETDAGELAIRLTVGQLHQPEIDEFRLNAAVDGQEKIERFEIAMHDSLVVRGRETMSDGQHDLPAYSGMS